MLKGNLLINSSSWKSIGISQFNNINEVTIINSKHSVTRRNIDANSPTEVS